MAWHWRAVCHPYINHYRISPCLGFITSNFTPGKSLPPFSWKISSDFAAPVREHSRSLKCLSSNSQSKAAWAHSLWSPSASLLITLYRAGLNSQKSPLSQSPPTTSGACDLIWELFKLFLLIDGRTRSPSLFTSRETYNIAETAFSQQEGTWLSFCSSSALKHLFHCSGGESVGGAVVYGNIWWNSWWRQQKWCLKHLY